MGRFGDTLWKRGKCLCVLTLSFCLLPSCSLSHLDEVRPEVNRSGGLVVLPESFAQQVEQLKEDDGTISGSGGSNGSNSGLPNLPDMPAPGGGKDGIIAGGDTLLNQSGFTNAKTDSQMLSCTSYGAYLDKYVRLPIQEAIEAAGAENAKDLYFRIIHTGYDPMGIDNSTVMEVASPYQARVLGARVCGKNIGGYEFSKFAFDYLYSLPGNMIVANSQRSAALSTLNRANSISPTTTWTQAQTASLPFSNNYIAMWGNERLDAESAFSKYLTAIRSSMVGTIPNIGMYVKTSVNSGNGTYVKLNACDGNVKRYIDNVTITAANYIFNTYNPHEDHVVSKVLTDFSSDDHAMVWYRVDGWGKTIVLLGTDTRNTLSNLLGAQYSKVMDTFEGIQPNTAWATITSMAGMEKASTISAGARGTS